ncbi:MAG: GTPase [Clostridia bacterium]|nr:GTPase [Clostridia bacterium]
MARKEIPVYLITGFLESGKTTFLQETLSDEGFYQNEKTLVILCEEGEEELDPSTYPSEEVYLEVIDAPERLTREYLTALENKYAADRIMIEYNGMWLLDNLYRVMPEHWLVYQEVMFVDGSTFLEYNTNMRQLVVDKLQSADPVIFNRVKPCFDKMLYHKTVRGISRACRIVYEYTDGKIEPDEIEDPLPFDLNAPVVAIGDDDFAYFYRDISEDVMKYHGKTVSFLGICVRDEKFPKDTVAIGRQMMVCCADDMTYRGFAVKTPMAKDLNTGMWVKVTAKVSIEANPLYQGKGPVLKNAKITYAMRPERPVAVFG